MSDRSPRSLTTVHVKSLKRVETTAGTKSLRTGGGQSFQKSGRGHATKSRRHSSSSPATPILLFYQNEKEEREPDRRVDTGSMTSKSAVREQGYESHAEEHRVTIYE